MKTDEKNVRDAVLYIYRYIFKTKDNPDRLGVKYLTDTLEGHQKMIENVLADAAILSCLREYIGEIDCSFIGFTDTFKKEEK